MLLHISERRRASFTREKRKIKAKAAMKDK